MNLNMKGVKKESSVLQSFIQATLFIVARSRAEDNTIDDSAPRTEEPPPPPLGADICSVKCTFAVSRIWFQQIEPQN